MSYVRTGLRLVAQVGLFLIWGGLTLSLAWPVIAPWLDNTPARRSPLITGVNFLIVAPHALSDSAQAWAAYRQTRGYATQVMTMLPEAATIETIRTAIQAVYVSSGRPYPFYVLLLGHAHLWSDERASYLPAATVALNLPQVYLDSLGFDTIASDDAYALAGDSLLPIAFGRVPARTNEEALRVLTRTQDYEHHPPSGFNRTQVELIASESGFGPEFDTLIEQLVIFFVQEHLPVYYRWHMLYGHPNSVYSYPAPDFPAEVARRLNQSAVLVTYIGHGSSDYLGPALSETGWEGPVFTSADAPLVTEAQGSLVMMLACSAGEYDQVSSLAEQMLLQPGGAVATYAASRLTLPAANTILGKDLFRVLLAGQAPTAGEWIRLAESNYRNPGSDMALSLWLLTRAIPPLYSLAIRGNPDETPPLEAELVYGLQQHAYNLFGDPALALAIPRPELQVQPDAIWQPFGMRVKFSGRGDLASGQTVTVTLYTRQGDLLPRTDTAVRYPAANDKIVAQQFLRVTEAGRLVSELMLPPNTPSGHYILEVLAVNDQATLVGAQAVYLGWPPLGELLSSTLFWWGVMSVGLGLRYARKSRPHAQSSRRAR